MRLKEIKPGMVIHCKTEKEVILLCEWVKKRNGLSITKDFESEMLDAFRNDYCFGIRENCLEFTVNWGGRATEFSDLIIPELSAAEVLKICNEICATREGVNCSGCKMHHNCFFDLNSDYQKVVEVCEQWKADREKKEPEFEWVDICRIIEVQDNGFKKCVHEVDIKDSELPFGYKECCAEQILKEYMRIHIGNYFATVEHVCRVKK